MEHNDRTIITRQGFISLTAKQSLARLFSPKNAILACESSKQLALGFTSASASWRFDRELNMFFLSFFFFFFCCTPTRLRAVVWARCKALWECRAPAALCRYTSLCFYAQTHQNGRVRLLSPGTCCCSTGGLKLFMKHFHSQRCAE